MSLPAAWEPLPVPTDPQTVILKMLADMAANRDGWVAREGALDVAVIEEIAIEVAASNARLQDYADSYAAGIGVSVDGLPLIAGAAATLPVTLTLTGPGAQSPAGLLIAAGTGDTAQLFTIDTVQTAGAGGLVTTTARATTPGSAPNGLGGAGATLRVVTSTTTVISATATAAATGGVDPETRTEYLTRLKARRAILRPGGVRASDITALARNTPGVERALALDLYDAQTGTSPAERTVSVFPVDVLGRPVDNATKTTLRSSLEQVREVNFIFRVADPQYTALAVTFTAAVRRGSTLTPDQVKANIIKDVLAYLSPARWGTTATDDAEATDWVATPVVRYLDVVRVAGSADGAALTGLQLNGTTSDVTLPGVAALPAPSVTTPGITTLTTCTGTVS